MDDLLGEDWKAPSKPNNTAPPNPTAFASNFSALRPTPPPPRSDSSTPQNLSRPGSTVNGAKASSGDQFGNLLSLKSQKPSSNLSIQERQKQLLEEKRKQQEQNAQMWDSLGSGRATPEVRGQAAAAPPPADDEDDILAAFNKHAPVDNASHYPPPLSGNASGRGTPAAAQPLQSVGGDFGTFDDDDDPFGLGAAPQKSNGQTAAPIASQSMDDDDDILGDLGKPVTEKPPKPEPPAPRNTRKAPANDTEDRGVAELVDMGFPADNAKIALAETGGDVQGAVGWLLLQAHEESKQKAKSDAQGRSGTPNAGGAQGEHRNGSGSVPSWAREDERSSSAARRQDSRSPANGEKDPSQVAQEFGSKLFKSANSFWKAGQKQVAKKMSEFQQQERDPAQPKWMSEASGDSSRASSQQRSSARPPLRSNVLDATDEAAMLDAPRETRPPKPSRSAAPESSMDLPSRGRSPLEEPPSRTSSQPKFMQQAAPQDKRPASKLSRQAVEEQSAQAYVSPARRKKATPKPEPEPEPEVDLFSPAPPKPAASAPAKSAATPAARSSPAPPRPKAPPRYVPSVSPSALSTSAQHRKKGGEAFKRGDYVTAHESYSAALSPLPATHPIAIIVLSNRSLTGLKTGDAKTAVSDADRALEIIGVSQGINETIDMGAGEGQKEMREFYGKALMRKAEALEHMEKWSDAGQVWKQAIQAGVGGAVSLKGRDRCEKAVAPKPTAVAPKAAPARSAAGRAPPAKGLGNSNTRSTLTNASSAEAVKQLRAANEAADKADDEKFALTDQVDARLTTWKGGKADNLRALLQSLDGVLWADAGWKKVGMSDLVMPNKVKIIYMKAIGKVHPDKIPQNATTEQRMISAAVFSTLNEAWDKFKKDNNL